MKFMKRLFAVVICILSFAPILPAFAQEDMLKELEEIAVIEQKIMVSMHDGDRLPIVARLPSS